MNFKCATVSLIVINSSQSSTNWLHFVSYNGTRTFKVCRDKQESQVTHTLPNDQHTRANEHVYGNIIQLPIRKESIKSSSHMCMKIFQTRDNSPWKNAFYSQITNTIQSEHCYSYVKSQLQL